MRWASIVLWAVVVLGPGLTNAGTVSGTATVGRKPAAGAVVYLEGAQERELPPVRPHAVMNQKNLAFVPAVLPVVRGTVVEFTNSDDVQHNVFSPSEAAGSFDLGTHGPGGVSSVTLDRPGDVLVLCNIHMEMEAHILVLNDPYFTVVARDGSYHIRDVSPGTYTLRIWQEHLLPFSQNVDVRSADTLTLDLRVDK